MIGAPEPCAHGLYACPVCMDWARGRLRALAEVATPGEWLSGKNSDRQCDMIHQREWRPCGFKEHNHCIIAQTIQGAGTGEPDKPHAVALLYPWLHGSQVATANAEFMAACSPPVVAALLDEIERLRGAA